MLRPPRALLTATLALCALVAGTVSAGAVGTDPGLAQQWGLRQIGASTAWAGGAVVGAGVPIAILDTGVDLGHEDLRDQIGAAVTCVGTGGDPAKCKTDGADIEGHGSHVAGIAAAAGNNVGTSGVAPGARIIAVRVFVEEGGEFSASADDINAGIRWVIRNVARKGVINLSLGGDFVVTTVLGASFVDGIEESWAAGWVPVLASGNENVLGLGSSNYGSLNALVVGATGTDDKVASYSSPTGNAKWGLVAPGGDAGDGCTAQPAECVLSTYKGGQYAFLQGTSMATPHVAGAAAVLMGAGRTNIQAVDRLLSTANKGVACGARCHGRLDLAKAAEGLAPAPAVATTAPPPAPSPAPGTAPPPAQTSGDTPAPGTALPPSGRVRLPASPAPTAPIGTEPATTVESAPEPTAVVDDTATTGSEPPASDGLTGLTITAAQQAVQAKSSDDDVPLALALLAGSAVLGVGGWIGIGLRRRRSSAGTAN